MRSREIQRLSLPTIGEFRGFEARREPVVITGALAAWPALARWSFGWLESVHGDARVRVRTSARVAPQLFSGFTFETMELRRALEEIENAGERVLYVQYCDLERELPRLAGEIHDLPYRRQLLCSPALLWISGRGVVNPLHWDYNHVALAQVHGEKRLLLFDPAESPRLASYAERTVWRTSSLDLAARGVAELEAVSAFSASLAPGDVLFIPYRWWHYAECDGPSISVSWWWEPSIFAHYRDAVRERLLIPVKRVLRARAVR